MEALAFVALLIWRYNSAVTNCDWSALVPRTPSRLDRRWPGLRIYVWRRQMTACKWLIVLAAPALVAQRGSTFTPTGSMSVPRQSHTATLLTSGKVLITGGVSDYAPNFTGLLNAELYDPINGTFIASGKMTTARIGHTAT